MKDQPVPASVLLQVVCSTFDVTPDAMRTKSRAQILIAARTAFVAAAMSTRIKGWEGPTMHATDPVDSKPMCMVGIAYYVCKSRQHSSVSAMRDRAERWLREGEPIRDVLTRSRPNASQYGLASRAASATFAATLRFIIETAVSKSTKVQPATA